MLAKVSQRFTPQSISALRRIVFVGYLLINQEASSKPLIELKPTSVGWKEKGLLSQLVPLSTSEENTLHKISLPVDLKISPTSHRQKEKKWSTGTTTDELPVPNEDTLYGSSRHSDLNLPGLQAQKPAPDDLRSRSQDQRWLDEANPVHRALQLDESYHKWLMDPTTFPDMMPAVLAYLPAESQSQRTPSASILPNSQSITDLQSPLKGVIDQRINERTGKRSMSTQDFAKLSNQPARKRRKADISCQPPQSSLEGEALGQHKGPTPGPHINRPQPEVVTDFNALISKASLERQMIKIKSTGTVQRPALEPSGSSSRRSMTIQPKLLMPSDQAYEQLLGLVRRPVQKQLKTESRPLKHQSLIMTEAASKSFLELGMPTPLLEKSDVLKGLSRFLGNLRYLYWLYSTEPGVRDEKKIRYYIKNQYTHYPRKTQIRVDLSTASVEPLLELSQIYLEHSTIFNELQILIDELENSLLENPELTLKPFSGARMTRAEYIEVLPSLTAMFYFQRYCLKEVFGKYEGQEERIKNEREAWKFLSSLYKSFWSRDDSIEKNLERNPDHFTPDIQEKMEYALKSKPYGKRKRKTLSLHLLGHWLRKAKDEEYLWGFILVGNIIYERVKFFLNLVVIDYAGAIKMPKLDLPPGRPSSCMFK